MDYKNKPTKCISVRLKAFFKVSEKCYKAIAFDGTNDLIPASEYYGPDNETTKSKAYWIAEWILKRKILQRKTKDPKIAWFDKNGQKYSKQEIKTSQNQLDKPRRTPRRTRFTVTYTNKRTGEKYKCIIVELNEEAAKTSVMTKFNSGNLDFGPFENGQKNEIEIISVEKRPGRNKPAANNAKPQQDPCAMR